MTHPVVMPQLGLTMTEGAVSVWLKQPGERVEKGQPLFSVETDKVEMEVEATVSGYLAAVLAEPKQMVPVGTAIAVIADSADEIATAALAAAPGTAPAQAPAPPAPVVATDGAGAAAAPSRSGYAASPRARSLAKELGVGLSTVTPSKGDRITVEDVQRAHDQTPKRTPAAVPSSARTVVAERMTASFQSAPHFYLGVEVDATALVELRNRCVRTASRDDVRITYTDLFLMATARAMREQPAANSFWNEGRIAARESVDLGLAVQTERMLYVPMIRAAAALSLTAIARERVRLIAKARGGKLTLADMEGGSATLSNLGAFGVDWFQPVLNPPQAVLIATGRIARRAVVVDDRIEARDTFTLTAAFDHRVLDGAAAATLLVRIKALLEEPTALLV